MLFNFCTIPAKVGLSSGSSNHVLVIISFLLKKNIKLLLMYAVSYSKITPIILLLFQRECIIKSNVKYAIQAPNYKISYHKDLYSS